MTQRTCLVEKTGFRLEVHTFRYCQGVILALEGQQCAPGSVGEKECQEKWQAGHASKSTVQRSDGKGHQSQHAPQVVLGSAPEEQGKAQR